jgi:hypothetical protein
VETCGNLWKLVQANQKSNPKHQIDDLIAEYGHKVLRLPAYHCELNPIEIIWSQIKQRVQVQNNTFKMKNVFALIKQSMEEVTAAPRNTECWTTIPRKSLAEERTIF